MLQKAIIREAHGPGAHTSFLAYEMSQGYSPFDKPLNKCECIGIEQSIGQHI